MGLTLQELAHSVGAEVHGDVDCIITNVATLEHAQAGSISFLSNRIYKKYLPETRASAVILHPDDLKSCPVSALITNNPYATYAKVARMLNPIETFQPGIHPSAVVSNTSQIDASATIGPNCVIEDGVKICENVYLGPGCVVGKDSTIGASSRLIANISICHEIKIGKNVLIHSGVVIGSDGFGIANEQGNWIKVPQLGGVRIDDNVEIGANTTIDRGALEDTVVEEGVKLDNQIQVGHNVHIGAHTAIAGCVGIAGSTHIGKNCAIGGAAVILGHLKIVDGVQITVMSMVTKSITKPGTYSSGTPLQSNDLWHKNFVRFRHLDEMARKIRVLEKKIDTESNKES